MPSASSAASTSAGPQKHDPLFARNDELALAEAYGQLGVLFADPSDPHAPVKRSIHVNVLLGDATVGAGLARDVVQRIARTRAALLGECYAHLNTDRELASTVAFVVSKGRVSNVTTTGDLQSTKMVACVKKAFESMAFPEDVPRVVVKYPIAFIRGALIRLRPSDLSDPSKGTIHGKPLGEVTATEIEEALLDAGASDVFSNARKGIVVFTVQLRGKTFTLTFAPAGGTQQLAADEKARLRAAGALFERETFVLAIESDVKAASQGLLDRLIEKP